MTRLSYEYRLEKSNSALLRKLFKIIIDKKSTLCVAADLSSFDEIVKLVEKIGQHICILKVHTRRCGGNLEENLKTLYSLKKRFNFLLFEDCKFFDGKETIEADYAGMYVKYVDLVTVIPICGDGIFKAIENGARLASLPDSEPRGCLSVCEVSFSGFVGQDTGELVKITNRNSSICVGIIAQKLQVDDPYSMIKASPGVHINKTTDGENQQWRTPDKVVGDGADVVIVGRGIVAAPEQEWEPLAREYKEESYQAYLRALNS